MPRMTDMQPGDVVEVHGIPATVEEVDEAAGTVKARLSTGASVSWSVHGVNPPARKAWPPSTETKDAL